jgi:phenylpropionate dioxygenase-like ring-hydroxylating dioxygenase large terminal subunit
VARPVEGGEKTAVTSSPTRTRALIDKESYYSAEYLRLENERLWPRVWQMACREEEIPKVGDYLTYEVGDESIIVVRTLDGEIRAHYNVCQHRGRQLTEGCGHALRFHCRFHGWQYELDGSNAHIVDEGDWDGELDAKDLGLPSVRVDTWGGWVFVNPDDDCEPLADFLGEAAEILAPFELQRMRYRWRKWLVMPCNWKVALEAFNEGYHVRTTHTQVLRWSDDPSRSAIYGKHAMFGFPEPAGIFGTGSARLGQVTDDNREPLAEFYRYMKRALDSNMTDTMVAAAQRLPELPDGTSPLQVLEELGRMAIEDDARRGVAWPNVTPEQLLKAGTDWHIFPNMVFLQQPTNLLGYRARPNGDDPDTCIFEVYGLERFANGGEPVVENLRNDDIYDEDFWGEILLQDFQQMAATQRGMKSKGYAGPVINPLQETALSNFHRVYHGYLGAE